MTSPLRLINDDILQRMIAPHDARQEKLDELARVELELEKEVTRLKTTIETAIGKYGITDRKLKVAGS